MSITIYHRPDGDESDRYGVRCDVREWLPELDNHDLGDEVRKYHLENVIVDEEAAEFFAYTVDSWMAWAVAQTVAESIRELHRRTLEPIHIEHHDGEIA